MRYLSIFFEHKDLDRQTHVKRIEQSIRHVAMKVRSPQVPLMVAWVQTLPFRKAAAIEKSPILEAHVFNGEFDSGSERTLAAWIRHASRTGFPLVAILEEV